MRLKAENKGTATAGKAPCAPSRGVAAAPSDGARAGATLPRARPVRGLSGVVAEVVTFEEEGVFRNVVKFL